MPEPASPTTLPQLARLRRRLTLWYAATSFVMLALLGAGVLWIIESSREGELHRSLHAAAASVARAQASSRENASATDGPGPITADGPSPPAVYLFAHDGQPVSAPPGTVEPWIRDAAVRAARDGRAEVEHDGPNNETLFLYAERFTSPVGEPRVAVAVTADVELEDRYAGVITAFGLAALGAVLIVAAGGWMLVKVSTTPIEASIGEMRRFVADAAHELRSPLTVLRSRAEIALQQPRDALGYVETLRGVESDARRLAGVVDDLFTLARADARERPRAHDRIALDDVVVETARTARLLADPKGVTIALSEYEEAWVDGDAELLQRLVMILMDNAIKFTATGGTVTVHVGSTGQSATVIVEDTGIGIAPEHLPHIFNRFFRADAARQHVAGSGGGRGGAGLGLSIARWIAEAHGADITVQSELGKGTRMTVRFPPRPA